MRCCRVRGAEGRTLLGLLNLDREGQGKGVRGIGTGKEGVWKRTKGEDGVYKVEVDEKMV